MSAFVGVNSI